MRHAVLCSLLGALVGVADVLARPGPLAAQAPAPGPGRPDPAVLAAWEEAGAVPGWTWIDARGDWQFDSDASPAGALPAFRLSRIPPGGVRALLMPDFPFALWI